MDPLDTPVQAVNRLGGVARTRDVVRLTSRTRVRTAVRRGELLRVARGRLATPAADRARAMARLANGHVSHLSAALHHGWAVKRVPDLPQLIVPHDRATPDGHQGFIADVRARRLAPSDVDGWTTAPLRTVLDCAKDLPFSDALCVADSALRHGDLTADDLVAAAATHGPRARRVAAHATARAANPFESALRALCIRAGIEVIAQFRITCAGLVLHPDLANPLLGLVVEADSYTFHGMEPWDHDRDCTRYNAMVLAGWAVLRFTWDQVMNRPDEVVATLRAWIEGSATEGPEARHAG